MANVKLTHNPYLLETTVLFNGRPPRINSAIERYEKRPLVDWIGDIPGILYDEMNGYDFDLDFSGTEADFIRLQQAFSNAGISQESVRLQHSQQLEDVTKKREEISSALHWLKHTPNRQFDFALFSERNVELFSESIPLIMLFADAAPEPLEPLSAEVIEGIDELESTDLTYSPIVIFVASDTAAKVRSAIPALLSRSDVTTQQLFFALSPTVNKSRMTRTLCDLGIDHPQIVQSPYDTQVLEYAASHPLTEGVREAIKALESAAEEIGSRLDEEDSKCERFGASSQSMIRELEDEIQRLRDAEEAFEHLPIFNEPRDFPIAAAMLRSSLKEWRSRKTKLSNGNEAMKMAAEYALLAQELYGKYQTSITNAVQKAKKGIDTELFLIYKRAHIDSEFSIPFQALKPIDWQASPNMYGILLGLKHESYVEQRKDFLGFFNQGSVDKNGMVKVVTYYLDSWRSRAVDYILPPAKESAEQGLDALRTYRANCAEEYILHIKHLINQRLEAKEEAAAKLSDEERALQADKDWLTGFREKLQIIKRG